jgi:peptide/nickel transport system substrate-binding protein
MSKHTKTTFAAMIGGLSLVLATPFAAIAQDGSTIVVGLNSSILNADPHFQNAQRDANFWPHVFESLVTIGENLGTAMQLADSYDLSDDGLTYTFHLREDVKFHNGETLTSEDVKASWERYQRISPNATALGAVASMDAPDDLTFIVTLGEAQPLFIELMASPQFPIVIYPADDGDTERGENSGIGTGPYKIVEMIPDDRTVLERFDDYAMDSDAAEGFDGYAGQRVANVDRIILRSIPEASTRVAGLQTGELTISDNLPVPASVRLTGEEGFVAQDVMPFSKAALIFHTGNGPSDNVLFRRAVQAAINPEEIMEVALEGFYALDPSFMFDFSPYYPGDSVDRYYNIDDPERAKSLLEEAGYDGEPVVIQTNTNYNFMQNMALVVAEQLKEIGINVEMDIVDWPTNVSGIVDGVGGWNITFTGYGSQPTIGPAGWLPIMTSHSHVESDPTFDELSQALLNEPDAERRKQLWLEIETHVDENAYILIVGDRGLKVVASADLEGYASFYSMRFWNTSLAE